MDAKINGSLSLEEQRLQLSAAEQAGPCLLKNYAQGTPAPYNFPSFVDVPLGQPIPDLILVQLPAQTVLAATVEAQKAAGRTLVCCNQVYVNRTPSWVAVFR